MPKDEVIVTSGQDPSEADFGQSDNLIRINGRPAMWFSDCVEEGEIDENCNCDWCQSKRALRNSRLEKNEQQNRVAKRF